jgi:SAM-dependent methyltransferase
MKRTFVEELVCPLSADPLSLEAEPGDDVETGELVCTGCGERWPVEHGIPQWQHFSELHPEFEAQFLDWLAPIGREFFEGKRVLDAGCGNGRHAYLAASFGAREVVGLDLSGAVDAARHNVLRFDNVEIVQGDLLRPPFRTAAEGGGFDLVYSIGVLHHLPDPHAGFVSLTRFVRPEGSIAIWVYGHENNGLVRHVVEPIRRVSTRVPTPLLRFMAWPLAVGFHGAARLVYRPLHGTAVGNALPLHDYLASVSDFSFRQNYGIVFDQLSAPTAAYLKESDLTGWLRESGLSDVHLSHRHGNSWRARGRRTATST